MILGGSELAAQALKATKFHFLPFLILLVLVIGTYHELPNHNFLDNWDDPGYVTGNQAIRSFNLANLKAAFTRQFVGNYSPIQIVSYMLDYSVWGLNPGGFLVSNITIHFLNGMLLYLFLIRNGIWKWGAVLGSALFLVHPVQMESVAWISQRKNLLALLFSLLGFHAYLNYCKAAGRMSWKWYAYSFSVFILALLSKPVAVVFPLILIMHDRLMSVRCRPVRWHIDKIPYLIAACVVAIITIMIQEPGAVGGRIEYPATPWLTLPLTMLPVLVSYLHILVWPAPSGLSIIYTTPFRHGLDATVLFALCIAVFLLAFGIYLYRKERHICFWYALFFLGFLPVSQVVPLVTLMNDRYLYFPMLGIAGLTGHLFSLCREERIQLPMLRLLCFVSAAAVVAVLSAASHVRGRVWQNSITLFSDAAIKAPYQLNPLLGLAEGYRAAGNNDMALKYYEEASKYGYLNADVSLGLARIYLDLGDLEKAHSHIWGFLLKSSNPKEGLLLLDEYKLLTGQSKGLQSTDGPL